MTYRIRAVDPFDDEDAADEIKHLHAQCMPEDPLQSFGESGFE